VEYFCREIWPGVLAKVPQARFRIVGRNPGDKVQRLASNSVEVTGRVPSVIKHLQEAALVVVPLRIGGGTRLKIYEAMAAGKAVVSTTVGAEGLDVHHGRDILLSDTANTFAGSVVMLLQNEEARGRLGAAAAELASKQSWPRIGAEFWQILQGVIGESFKAAPRYGKASENLNNTASSR
jgi:glycosyltransferase involved in cell wall biosynthesis